MSATFENWKPYIVACTFVGGGGVANTFLHIKACLLSLPPVVLLSSSHSKRHSAINTYLSSFHSHNIILLTQLTFVQMYAATHFFFQTTTKWKKVHRNKIRTAPTTATTIEEWRKNYDFHATIFLFSVVVAVRYSFFVVELFVLSSSFNIPMQTIFWIVLSFLFSFRSVPFVFFFNRHFIYYFYAVIISSNHFHQIECNYEEKERK